MKRSLVLLGLVMLAGCGRDSGSTAPIEPARADLRPQDPAPPAAATADEAPDKAGKGDRSPGKPLTGAALEERVARAMPVAARTGHLVFRDPSLLVPEAAPLFAARLRATAEPQELRVALAEVIGRTGRGFAPLALELLEAEADPRVRQVLVARLWLADDVSAAHDALRIACADADRDVRLVAVQAAGRRADGEALADSIVTALADADAGVRAAAAASVAARSITSAADQLERLLEDGEPKVRLAALRALHGLDAQRSLVAAERLSLKDDADVRVRRFVEAAREGRAR